MIGDQEISGHSRPNSNTEVKPTNEQERLGLYKDILYREATSLLAKYLPEALPHEPTTIGFAIQARYEGRFRGMHYIATSSEATDDLIFKQARTEFQEGLKKSWEKQFSKEERQKAAEDDNEYFRKMKEEGKDIPDDAFIDVDKVEAIPYPRETKEEEDNWDKLTGSLDTMQGYSVYTWQAIQTTIHELIHQRQEELNPQLSEELSSPELEQIDPKNTSSYVMSQLAREASKAKVRATPEEAKTSMCFVVMEGMASIGCSYVMKRLEDDLTTAGDTELAIKVSKIRSDRFHDDTTEIHRDLKTGKKQPSDYAANYLEGARLMRKLYKQFGETTPKLLTQVDLQACLQITKGSPQYQQIMENPVLLPGLLKAA